MQVPNIIFFFVLLCLVWPIVGCDMSAADKDVQQQQDTSSCFGLDQHSCFDCLVEDNQEGYQEYQESIFSNCYCGFECAARCERFCDDTGSIDEGCADCFAVVSQDPQSVCIFDVLAQCEQDESCIEFVFMIQECSP